MWQGYATGVRGPRGWRCTREGVFGSSWSLVRSRQPTSLHYIATTAAYLCTACTMHILPAASGTHRSSAGDVEPTPLLLRLLNSIQVPSLPCFVSLQRPCFSNSSRLAHKPGSEPRAKACPGTASTQTTSAGPHPQRSGDGPRSLVIVYGIIMSSEHHCLESSSGAKALQHTGQFHLIRCASKKLVRWTVQSIRYVVSSCRCRARLSWSAWLACPYPPAATIPLSQLSPSFVQTFSLSPPIEESRRL